MAKKCRILDLPPANALYNTALDKFLLEKAAQGEFTLAFTRWFPSVLVGRSQNIALDVDLAECQKRGIGVMRRLSGGQAVYLDDSYIVFTLAGPRSHFPTKLDDLRRQICEASAKALRQLGIPAVFYKPDNLVVDSDRLKTLGNSGQVIKREVVAVEASIRYDLPTSGLQEMLAVLRTNGRSLKEFFEPAKRSLACIKHFRESYPKLVKAFLAGAIATSYGCEVYNDSLAPEEDVEVHRRAAELAAEPLQDQPHYTSRGVCYFYLNGRCIVPEIADFLAEVKPSTYLESTIS
ncbi:MAG: lipoate-protein ligase A [Parcubacteria group bacterium Gr01-1014_30]|nr:MAG: lipoate-protein ligase A [Parcubacteria group bacterium Gr01-1014_30]